jgi:HEAT repeat protein
VDDPSREVRVAVAHGLGSAGEPSAAPLLARLADDADDLVRAAALESFAGIGCPAPLDATAATALGDAAWEVRVGAARALAAATAAAAVGPLVKALDDANLDVRKAAVIALGRWAGTDADAAEALRRAGSDVDADVRAYARRSLASLP